jgi:hypothetical protein
MTTERLPRQICFMVMPFGTKPTGATEGPSEVDFDHLWQEALRPAIESVGYDVVRADQDWGPVIVKEMLERLVACDLVIADVSIPNANVYYEIGVRHAARDVGCILIAADWARPLFDIQQMTRIPYPLPHKIASEAEAAKIMGVLGAAIPKAALELTPIKSLIPGYPDVDRATLGAFRHDLAELRDLQTEARTIRLLPRDKQGDALDRVVRAILSEPQISPSATLEVLYLLCDCGQWDRMVAVIDRLPASLRDMEVVQEQEALALSNIGDHGRSVAMLETLIERFGPTPERLGILGGRYKRLYRETGRRAFLDKAIEAYEKGFGLDLNAYYCGSNLPPLLKERNGDGDIDRARAVSHVVAEACHRARDSGTDDEWPNATLLGLAFDVGDVPLARECLSNVRKEGHAAWRLETTLGSLEHRANHIPDSDVRRELLEICREMAKIVQEARE